MTKISETWDVVKNKQILNSTSNERWHEYRLAVWNNTVKIVNDGRYFLKDGTCIKLEPDDALIADSKFYFQEIILEKILDTEVPRSITVIKGDSLDQAHNWVKQGHNVCVLNMANRRNPGGGVHKGSGAQEEYLFRCSNYFRSLFQFASYATAYGLPMSQYQYPLDRNYGGIYSPGVTIFRGNEDEGYPLLKEPWKVNMIAVAAIRDPQTEVINNETRICADFIPGTKNKIRTIFRIAAANQQNYLVLSAFGCGAFHNPPRHMAELFMEILSEPEFHRAFREICFAIKPDHNSNGDSNYEAFLDVFSMKHV